MEADHADLARRAEIYDSLTNWRREPSGNPKSGCSIRCPASGAWICSARSVAGAQCGRSVADQSFLPTVLSGPRARFLAIAPSHCGTRPSSIAAMPVSALRQRFRLLGKFGRDLSNVHLAAGPCDRFFGGIDQDRTWKGRNACRMQHDRIAWIRVTTTLKSGGCSGAVPQLKVQCQQMPLPNETWNREGEREARSRAA